MREQYIVNVRNFHAMHDIICAYAGSSSECTWRKFYMACFYVMHVLLNGLRRARMGAYVI